jgi:hypothetical protein
MVTGHSYEVRSFVFCDLYDTVTRSVAGHLLVHVRSMGTLDSRHTGTHMGLVVICTSSPRTIDMCCS